MIDVEPWQELAACRGCPNPDSIFFPEQGGSTREARRICCTCPVRMQCLDFALTHDERFGVWGGLPEKERRKAKRGDFVKVAYTCPNGHDLNVAGVDARRRCKQCQREAAARWRSLRKQVAS